MFIYVYLNRKLFQKILIYKNKKIKKKNILILR